MEILPSRKPVTAFAARAFGGSWHLSSSEQGCATNYFLRRSLLIDRRSRCLYCSALLSADLLIRRCQDVACSSDRSCPMSAWRAADKLASELIVFDPDIVLILRRSLLCSAPMKNLLNTVGELTVRCAKKYFCAGVATVRQRTDRSGICLR